MTISPPHNLARYKNTREFLFIFNDSEKMTEGILFLYRSHYNFKSMLYKTEKDYRLIIKAPRVKPCFISLNEYCQSQSHNSIAIAYTKEYGKLLIESNAIKIYGKIFSK